MLTRGKHRGQKGFTIVELMVVVAVGLVLMSLAVNTVITVLPRYRLKRAARELVGSIQRTRLNAIKNNTSWRIAFDLVANSYQIESSGPDGVYGNADDPAPMAPVVLASYGSGVTFGAGNATSNWNNDPISQRATLSFSERGFCAAGSTYLTNQDNTVAYAASTSTSGAVRLHQYNGMLPFSINNWTD